MALGTYAELKASVASWLARDDLTAFIPDFIRLCESDFNARLRLLQMETTADLTINAETIAKPAGWLETQRLYISGTPRQMLEFVSPFQAEEMFQGDGAGRTLAYTIEGTNFRFFPVGGTGGTGKILYYQRFDALSADDDTNFVLTNFPGVYLFGALTWSAAFIQDDERIALWKGAYETQLRLCEEADQRARYSGSPIRSRPSVVI